MSSVCIRRSARCRDLGALGRWAALVATPNERYAFARQQDVLLDLLDQDRDRVVAALEEGGPAGVVGLGDVDLELHLRRSLNSCSWAGRYCWRYCSTVIGSPPWRLRQKLSWASRKIASATSSGRNDDERLLRIAR